MKNYEHLHSISMKWIMSKIELLKGVVVRKILHIDDAFNNDSTMIVTGLMHRRFLLYVHCSLYKPFRDSMPKFMQWQYERVVKAPLVQSDPEKRL